MVLPRHLIGWPSDPVSYDQKISDVVVRLDPRPDFLSPLCIEAQRFLNVLSQSTSKNLIRHLPNLFLGKENLISDQVLINLYLSKTMPYPEKSDSISKISPLI